MLRQLQHSPGKWSNMSACRILLVDDHVLVRQGLRRIIEGWGDYEVVGEYSRGSDFLSHLDLLNCDIILMDLTLSDCRGLDLLKKMREAGNQTPVIICSMHADEAAVLQALRLGALGYLLKTSEPSQLQQALGQVRQGNPYVDPDVLGFVVKQATAPIIDLTPKEREVLRLLADGKRIQEVASELVVSVNTAKTHLQSLYRKFGVSDKTQLVLLGIQSGVLNC